MDGSGDSKAGGPAFARTGITSPNGKLVCEIKTHVDEPTYNRFLQQCAQANVLPGEALRERLYEVVWGKSFSMSCAEYRETQMRGQGLLGAQGAAQ